MQIPGLFFSAVGGDPGLIADFRLERAPRLLQRDLEIRDAFARTGAKPLEVAAHVGIMRLRLDQLAPAGPHRRLRRRGTKNEREAIELASSLAQEGSSLIHVRIHYALYNRVFASAPARFYPAMGPFAMP